MRPITTAQAAREHDRGKGCYKRRVNRWITIAVVALLTITGCSESSDPDMSEGSGSAEGGDVVENDCTAAVECLERECGAALDVLVSNACETMSGDWTDECIAAQNAMNECQPKCTGELDSEESYFATSMWRNCDDDTGRCERFTLTCEAQACGNEDRFGCLEIVDGVEQNPEACERLEECIS